MQGLRQFFCFANIFVRLTHKNGKFEYLRLQRHSITGSSTDKWASRRETCLQWFVDNTPADQHAHLRSLISAFVIHFLESIISKLAISQISNF